MLALAILILLVYIAILETVGITTRVISQPPSNVSLRSEQRSKLSTGRGGVGSSYMITDLIPQDVLQYEKREEWGSFQHPWNVEPSPELDAVWEDLIFGMYHLHSLNVFISILPGVCGTK